LPDGNYTGFIMKVINAIIEVPQNSKEDARERTVFEKFTEFNEHLFWLTQQKDYQREIEEIERQNNQEAEGSTIVKKNSSRICDKFYSILSNSAE
jgi:hypothetical protein